MTRARRPASRAVLSMLLCAGALAGALVLFAGSARAAPPAPVPEVLAPAPPPPVLDMLVPAPPTATDDAPVEREPAPSPEPEPETDPS